VVAERRPDPAVPPAVEHKATHRGWDPALWHIPLFAGSHLPEPSTLFDDWSTRSTAYVRRCRSSAT
jgi:hypothetical protein